MFSNVKNMFKVPDLRKKIFFTLPSSPLPVRVPRARARHRLRRRPALSEASRGRRRARLPQPVLRRRAHPLRRVRARDHAVHHQLDHHAAAAGGDPQARAVAQRRARSARRRSPRPPATSRSRWPSCSRPASPSRSTTARPGFLGGGLEDLDLIPNFTVPRVLLVVLSMTAGTAMVMWLGELITQRGIGQGMSILIFASVVSGMPAGGAVVRAEAGNVLFAIIMLLVLAVLVAIVFIEQGQRRIPVQFAKRVVGRKMYGGQSSYIPLKVNQSGVIPIIFASSLLQFPVLISQRAPELRVGRVGPDVHQRQPVPAQLGALHRPLRRADRRLRLLLHGHRVRPAPAVRLHPQERRLHPRHPARAADRAPPGRASSTASRCPAPCSSPSSPCSRRWPWRCADIDNYPFAGTTLLIAVGVALETMKQIDSQLMMRNYDGFLRK